MEILLLLGLFLVSNIPAILLFLWIRKKGRDEEYKGICKDSFVKGIISSFSVILTSLIFSVLESVLGVKQLHPLLAKAIHTFITLALAEELVKFLTYRLVLKKQFNSLLITLRKDQSAEKCRNHGCKEYFFTQNSFKFHLTSNYLTYSHKTDTLLMYTENDTK